MTSQQYEQTKEGILRKQAKAISTCGLAVEDQEYIEDTTTDFYRP